MPSSHPPFLLTVFAHPNGALTKSEAIGTLRLEPGDVASIGRRSAGMARHIGVDPTALGTINEDTFPGHALVFSAVQISEGNTVLICTTRASHDLWEVRQGRASSRGGHWIELASNSVVTLWKHGAASLGPVLSVQVTGGPATHTTLSKSASIGTVLANADARAKRAAEEICKEWFSGNDAAAWDEEGNAAALATVAYLAQRRLSPDKRHILDVIQRLGGEKKQHLGTVKTWQSQLKTMVNYFDSNEKVDVLFPEHAILYAASSRETNTERTAFGLALVATGLVNGRVLAAVGPHVDWAIR